MFVCEGISCLNRLCGNESLLLSPKMVVSCHISYTCLLLLHINFYFPDIFMSKSPISRKPLSLLNHDYNVVIHNEPYVIYTLERTFYCTSIYSCTQLPYSGYWDLMYTRDRRMTFDFSAEFIEGKINNKMSNSISIPRRLPLLLVQDNVLLPGSSMRIPVRNMRK